MGLAKCRKTEPQLTIEKVILILTRMTTRLNIERNMTSPQIAFCAEDIVHSTDPFIYNLTLDELSLCMDKGVRGEYGEIYNRMDQAVVFGWIKKYIDEKMREGEKIRIENDDFARNNVAEIFNTPVMSEILHDITDKLKAKYEPEVKQIQSRERTPQEELIQQLIKEFDKEYLNSGCIIGGYKHVEYMGKMTSLEQYVNEGLLHLTEQNVTHETLQDLPE